MVLVTLVVVVTVIHHHSDHIAMLLEESVLTVLKTDAEDMVEMDLEVISIHMVEAVLVMVTGLLMVIVLDLHPILVDHNHHPITKTTMRITTNLTQHGDLEVQVLNTATEEQVDVTVVL